MKIRPGDLTGLLIIEPNVFKDQRGFFLETWHWQRYRENGLEMNFVQDNLSFSSRGTLRGLHYQIPKSQGKLISVLQGEVFDVAVDLRRGSPTFGKWHGITLSGENKLQFFIPPGFGHGFLVTSDTAFFQYKCTDYYFPKDEVTLRWNDPDLAISWPIEAPILSARDANAPCLRSLAPELLFE